MQNVRTKYDVVEPEESNDGGEDMNFDELFHNGDTPTKAGEEAAGLKEARQPEGSQARRSLLGPSKDVNATGAQTTATKLHAAAGKPPRTPTRDTDVVRTTSGFDAPTSSEKPGGAQSASDVWAKIAGGAGRSPVAGPEHQPGASRRVPGAGVRADQVAAHVQPHIRPSRGLASQNRLRAAAQHRAHRPEQAHRAEEEAHAG